MSRKEKKKIELPRAEIGSELKGLAEDLVQGRLRIGSHQVMVGEPISMQSKQKLDGDLVYFTLSLKMPVLSEASATGEGTSAPPPSPPKRERIETGYSGKRLKKEIGPLWKSVVKLIEKEEMPDAAETEGLLKKCEEYFLFAGSDWQADWTACTETVRFCLSSAAAGDWTAARKAITTVNQMIHDCHARYK